MKLAVGCDPAGFELKGRIVEHLEARGHQVADVGCHSAEPADYPDFAALVCRAVVAGDADRGILICGTGQGMAIAANKMRGIRAALCFDVLPAILSREHNNANVLCTGAWIVEAERAIRVVDAWLFGKYSGDPIHERRIDKIHASEGAPP